MRWPAGRAGSVAVEGRQPGQAGGGQHRAGDVVDDAGQVARGAIGIQQGGAFVAGGAVTGQFHHVSIQLGWVRSQLIF
jgi:hypothetical protein